MLTRMKKSIYFNNSNDYLNAANSTKTQLLRLVSDYVICFVQRLTTIQSSITKAVGKQKRNKASKDGRDTNIQNEGDSGTWWIARVQKMRRKVKNKWGSYQHPIDILNQIRTRSSKVGGPPYMVLLSWFSKASRNLKFKYDHCNSKWIDLDIIIATITLTYLLDSLLYKLERHNAENLNEFVPK